MIIHEIETYSLEKMALQLACLKETVRRVYTKVPFYQEKFIELDIKVEDIQTLEDVRKTAIYEENRST
jgi:phenylacetate-CoA ligase